MARTCPEARKWIHTKNVLKWPSKRPSPCLAEKPDKPKPFLLTYLEIIEQPALSDPHSTPILFVHGAWHAAWCWADYFMPYFAQHGYTSYAVSLRGHGQSEGRERLRWTSIADYVSDVARVVDQMDSPPVLVGHSMGTVIVRKYLESHQAPAAVLLAILSPASVLRASLRVARRHPLQFLKTNLAMTMFHVVGTPQLAQDALFSPDMPQDQVKKHFSRLQNESYRAYLDMLGLSRPRPDRVKTPLLALGGAGDSLISPREISATARAYGAKADFFANMAHDMMLEAGWRDVADRILGWLDEQRL